MVDLVGLDGRLAVHGLVRIGQFALAVGEVADTNLTAGILVGNGPDGMWPAFQADLAAGRISPGKNPLDRWTRQVVAPIAAAIGATAVYPFDEPPYRPFVTWAVRTGQVHASPLGIGIHYRFGLWLGLRAALLVAETLPAEPAQPSPCDTCALRPCLTACPVRAFTADGFNAAVCRGHAAGQGIACRTAGCLARRACPVGHSYSPEQAAFHMKAFIG